MIANIVLVIFLLAMMFWWSQQGVFSAILHLGLTIVAGSIALAFWEPLVLKFLIYRMPLYAWAVGLVAPFALLLIVMRLASDRLVRGNVHVMPLLSSIVGGFFGLLSGILTAGLVVIGVSFLPLGPQALGGYQPYATVNAAISSTGDSLWISVDSLAGRFFNRLSTGAFKPFGGYPLAVYQPDIAAQAGQIRLRKDVNSSIVAVPGTVVVEEVCRVSLPIEELADSLRLALPDQVNSATNQLVVVDTLWEDKPGLQGTFDADATARIPPWQVRLVTEQRSARRGAEIKMHTPVALGKELRGGERRFFHIDSDLFQGTAVGKRRLAWTFIVSADESPRFLLVRHLRLNLTNEAAWVGDPARVAALLGQKEAGEGDPDKVAVARANGKGGPPDPKGTIDGSVRMPGGHAGIEIERTNRLPVTFSKNGASGLRYNESCVVSGKSKVRKLGRGMGRQTKVSCIHHPNHMDMVRLKIRRDAALSFLGAALVAAADVSGMWLVDDQGEKIQPIAWNWIRKGGEQEISVDPLGKIRSAKLLPVTKMQEGDEIYLFFTVERGSTIVAYQVGKHGEQDVNLVVP